MTLIMEGKEGEEAGERTLVREGKEEAGESDVSKGEERRKSRGK